MAGALAKLSTDPTHNYASVHKATPFVKWAGGKRSLIPRLLEVVPDKFERYFEPFLGGGALFFALENRISSAVLSDLNQNLIDTYKAVKNDVQAVIDTLEIHTNKHGKRYYNSVRSQDPSDPIEAAARFIYLNRTCFNGLYRVNSKGKFNVPMGDYANPTICDADNLRAVAEILANIELRCQGFEEIKPGPGDLVYCDPPYDQTYNSYTAMRFNGEEHKQLSQHAHKWAGAGAKVIVSNSNTKLISKLYPAKNWKRKKISAQRLINCKAAGRKPVQELLIFNAR